MNITIRRITVISTTFWLSMALFIGFDAWWRSGESSYLGMLTLLLAKLVGHHPLFI